ncbi:hypothetical protein BDY19DRAFT_594436 [Irpex rosettiformis]|uniref:Uncharacterized protein n=1 Tax=Irpex rosettiformis TaxID=378272 RepID=A0ACB8UDK7_9APHY|nr:hypothetical protein BDY19DRAFT_594436 [Irpex rosettiformis]
MFNMPSRKQPNLTITPFSINPASQATTTYYSSWSSADLAVQYDHRGRLQPYVETSEQRRARLEFLRKREFSRRISAWLEDSSKSEMNFGTISPFSTRVHVHPIDVVSRLGTNLPMPLVTLSLEG